MLEDFLPGGKIVFPCQESRSPYPQSSVAYRDCEGFFTLYTLYYFQIKIYRKGHARN